jgi:preprotein translocase subunit YajC
MGVYSPGEKFFWDSGVNETMQTNKEIHDVMERVEEGDRILWNGRSVPQPVTEVDDAYFKVEGHKGGRYKFHKTSTPPELTNLNSDNDWDIEEIEIESI